MSLSIATWNVNSVRLRIGLVERVLAQLRPDILCLQETKCPQGQFPSGPLKEMGYRYIAEHGQKGYHGVAIVSRVPFAAQQSMDFCGKGDCRHVSVTLPSSNPVEIHNFYVPAGGDEPDPKANEKFAHKLQYLDEMENWTRRAAAHKGHRVLVGDLNIAPLPNDVWSHRDLLKVVSHTPIETEAMARIMAAGQWDDVLRRHIPPDQKLYTWWSHRAKEWKVANRGRRLDHIWSDPALSSTSSDLRILQDARDWPQCSDHVPVCVTFDM